MKEGGSHSCSRSTRMNSSMVRWLVGVSSNSVSLTGEGERSHTGLGGSVDSVNRNQQVIALFKSQHAEVFLLGEHIFGSKITSSSESPGTPSPPRSPPSPYAGNHASVLRPGELRRRREEVREERKERRKIERGGKGRKDKREEGGIGR